MNESTRGYKVLIAILLIALGIVSMIAFTRKGGGDDETTAKLSKAISDLDTCKTERLDFKNKFEEAQADLKKLKEEMMAGNTVNAGGVGATLKTTSGGPGLPTDQVTKIIALNKGGLKQCYERALKRDTGLQTQSISVTFRFYIHPTGTTGQTSLKSNSHIDPQLVDCFKQAVGRWKFPTFTGDPMPIELPVPFQPVGGG